MTTKKEYGISMQDYDGFIEEYSRRIKYHRPLMINADRELINLSDLGDPHAPLMITQHRELINLSDLEELLDPRDPRFKTHQIIDMRHWVSPKANGVHP